MRHALVAVLLFLPLPALAADPAPAANPFFTEWKTPFGVPPFAEIKEEHFLPAFKEGMARQKAEVAAHRRGEGGADLREHHRGPGAVRRSSWTGWARSSSTSRARKPTRSCRP